MKSYVVDLNMMQDPDLAVRIGAESTSRFVIPDVALVEMCKHQNCQLTMKLALQVFSGCTSQVEVATSVGEILNKELATRLPATAELILSSVFTHEVRQLITDLAQDQPQLNHTIQARFDSARSKLLGQELNATVAKGMTEAYLKILQKGLRPKLIRAIRKSTLNVEGFLSFAKIMAELYLHKWLTEDQGLDEETVRSLIDQKSMLLRHYYLLVRHCLLAVRNGGDISNMNAETELNHQLDMDYVMIASYFDGILTKDKRANDAHRDLLVMLAKSFEEAHDVSNDWFVESGVVDESGQVLP